MNETKERTRRASELPDQYRRGHYFPGSDHAALRAALGLRDEELTQLLADEFGMRKWQQQQSQPRRPVGRPKKQSQA